MPAGCITDPTTNYCVCDEDNGWVADTSNPASGLCVPVCLQTGLDTNIAVDEKDECWNALDNHATPLLTGVIQNTYSTDHLEIADSSYLTYSSTRGSGCK